MGLLLIGLAIWFIASATHSTGSPISGVPAGTSTVSSHGNGGASALRVLATRLLKATEPCERDFETLNSQIRHLGSSPTIDASIRTHSLNAYSDCRQAAHALKGLAIPSALASYASVHRAIAEARAAASDSQYAAADTDSLADGQKHPRIESDAISKMSAAAAHYQAEVGLLKRVNAAVMVPSSVEATALPTSPNVGATNSSFTANGGVGDTFDVTLNGHRWELTLDGGNYGHSFGNGAGSVALSHNGHFIVLHLAVVYKGTNLDGGVLDNDATFQLVDAQGNVYQTDDNAEAIYLSIFEGGKFQFDQVFSGIPANAIYVYDVPLDTGPLILEAVSADGDTMRLWKLDKLA